jgi:hypothetical protein
MPRLCLWTSVFRPNAKQMLHLSPPGGNTCSAVATILWGAHASAVQHSTYG